MSVLIEDGAGRGYKAKIGPNLHLNVSAVTIDPLTHQAIEPESAYNIQFGPVTLTAAGLHGFLHLTNNENSGLIMVVDKAILSWGPLTGATPPITLRVLKNPTAGTLVTGGAVAAAVNRNFGSIKPASIATRVWSANNQTITDGTLLSTALFPAPLPPSNFDIGWALPQGSSIGVTLELPAGSNNLVAALTLAVYYVDPENI